MLPLTDIITGFHDSFADMRLKAKEFFSSYPAANDLIQWNINQRKILKSGFMDLGIPQDSAIVIDGSASFDLAVPHKSDLDGVIIVPGIIPGLQEKVDKFVVEHGYKESNIRVHSFEDATLFPDQKLILLTELIQGDYLNGQFKPDLLASKMQEWKNTEVVLKQINEHEDSFWPGEVEKYRKRIESWGTGNKEASF